MLSVFEQALLRAFGAANSLVVTDGGLRGVSPPFLEIDLFPRFSAFS